MITWEMQTRMRLIGLVVLICALSLEILEHAPVEGANQARSVLDTAEFNAVGEPNQMIADSFDNATTAEIHGRLQVLESGRLAALRQIVEFRENQRKSSASVSFSDVLNNRDELCRAEIEYDNTSKTRLASFKTILEYAVQAEQDVRQKFDSGAKGGDSLAMATAIAARLKAEEQYIREILSRRNLPRDQKP